ncbi:MAG: hypothetical protein JNK02_01720 [Planctomycetes bacterium]|nr:hypothetical protein [Planctomycetota bacterium]
MTPFGDGRAGNGQFAAGNPGGPGNPYARQVAALRAAMLAAVSPEDLHAVVAKLVDLAKGGNVPAIREVLDRTLGKPIEADLLVRLEDIENRLARSKGTGHG